MSPKRLREIVSEEAVVRNGRRTLSCARAFALASKHKLPLRGIRRVCDRENIRIRACRLGCFR